MKIELKRETLGFVWKFALKGVFWFLFSHHCKGINLNVSEYPTKFGIVRKWSFSFYNSIPHSLPCNAIQFYLLSSVCKTSHCIIFNSSRTYILVMYRHFVYLHTKSDLARYASFFHSTFFLSLLFTLNVPRRMSKKVDGVYKPRLQCLEAKNLVLCLCLDISFLFFFPSFYFIFLRIHIFFCISYVWYHTYMNI